MPRGIKLPIGAEHLKMESGEGFEPSTSGFLADSYECVAPGTRPPRYRLRHPDSISLDVYHKRVARARLRPGGEATAGATAPFPHPGSINYRMCS